MTTREMLHYFSWSCIIMHLLITQLTLPKKVFNYDHTILTKRDLCSHFLSKNSIMMQSFLFFSNWEIKQKSIVVKIGHQQ